MNIDLQTVVVVSKEQMASNIGGETVILGMKKGHYYGVDGVGARVWQLIQEPSRVADLHTALVDEYNVDPQKAEADLLTLLGAMAEAGLIEVRTAPDA